MTDTARDQPARTYGRAIRNVLFIFAIIALAATNILTLIDEQFHTKAYGWLEAIVRSVSDGSILGNSPTEVRKHDVAVATQGLLTEKNVLTRRALDLTTDAIAIAAEIKAIKNEKLALEATAQAWEQRHRQVEDTLLKHRSSTQKLSKSVIQRVARNTSRNVSGLFGKSVPYLGIAVTLAMTGLDVVDACDTVRVSISVQ